MTVDVEKAACPRCGTTETYAIYIRSDDDTDLVCRSTVCREGRPLAMLPTEQASSSRQLFRRRR